MTTFTRFSTLRLFIVSAMVYSLALPEHLPALAVPSQVDGAATAAGLVRSKSFARRLNLMQQMQGSGPVRRFAGAVAAVGGSSTSLASSAASSTAPSHSGSLANVAAAASAAPASSATVAALALSPSSRRKDSVQGGKGRLAGQSPLVAASSMINLAAASAAPTLAASSAAGSAPNLFLSPASSSVTSAASSTHGSRGSLNDTGETKIMFNDQQIVAAFAAVGFKDFYEQTMLPEILKSYAVYKDDLKLLQETLNKQNSPKKLKKNSAHYSRKLNVIALGMVFSFASYGWMLSEFRSQQMQKNLKATGKKRKLAEVAAALQKAFDSISHDDLENDFAGLMSIKNLDQSVEYPGQLEKLKYKVARVVEDRDFLTWAPPEGQSLESFMQEAAGIRSGEELDRALRRWIVYYSPSQRHQSSEFVPTEMTIKCLLTLAHLRPEVSLSLYRMLILILRNISHNPYRDRALKPKILNALKQLSESTDSDRADAKAFAQQVLVGGESQSAISVVEADQIHKSKPAKSDLVVTLEELHEVQVVTRMTDGMATMVAQRWDSLNQHDLTAYLMTLTMPQLKQLWVDMDSYLDSLYRNHQWYQSFKDFQNYWPWAPQEWESYQFIDEGKKVFLKRFEAMKNDWKQFFEKLVPANLHGQENRKLTKADLQAPVATLIAKISA